MLIANDIIAAVHVSFQLSRQNLKQHFIQSFMKMHGAHLVIRFVVSNIVITIMWYFSD